MDILKSIEDQIAEINKMSDDISLEAVQTHIERAEMLYELGRENGDEQFFTDVIYRTNQAFEGSLKQAYMILANQSETETNKKRPFDIEDYFSSNSIFHDRVLHHFKNYRQEWRNKSTHDFKLFFSESEAFLAIVNVSAYTYVLFNQIIERLAYNIERERLERENKQKLALSLIAEQKNTNLKSKVIQLIQNFSKNNPLLSSKIREQELIGTFTAFLETASDDYKVQSEAVYKIGGQSMHIDLLLNTEDEELIIELKRPDSKFNHSFVEQVIRYMEISNIPNSILWIPRFINKNEELEIINNIEIFNGKDYEITIIK